MISAKTALENTKKYWKKNIDKKWESTISNEIFSASQVGKRCIKCEHLNNVQMDYLTLCGYTVKEDNGYTINW
jgi:hypothetical protein